VFGDGDLCVAPKRRLLAGHEVMEAARRASDAKGEVTVDGGRVWALAGRHEEQAMGLARAGPSIFGHYGF
jgi:hypothetical protein